MHKKYVKLISLQLVVLFLFTSLHFTANCNDNSGPSIVIEKTGIRNGKLVVSLFLNDCIGIKSCDLRINYDNTVLKCKDCVLTGSDAEKMSLYCIDNRFTNDFLIDNSGCISYSFYFKTVLYSSEQYYEDRKPGFDDVEINFSHFKCCEFLFDILNYTVPVTHITSEIYSSWPSGSINPSPYDADIDLGVLPYGTCGNDVEWNLDDEGVLTISGSGEMWDIDINDPLWLYRNNIKKVIIHEGVTGISNSFFTGCKALTSLTLPSSMITIGDSAFFGCTGISSITLPNNLETIGDSAFSGCTGLSSITIPDSVTSIGDSAFFGCTGLESLTLGSGTESIQTGEFSNCTSLTTVTIPATVYNIYDDAFKGCTSITNVYYFGTKEDWNDIYFGRENQSIKKANIHFYEKEIDTDTAKEIGEYLYFTPEQTASALLKLAGDGAKLTKADGSAVNEKETVGSGMKLTKADGTELTVIIKGDNDGDGKITASDARFALRVAVELEAPNTWELNASLVTGGENVTAADARSILRAAVGLEELNKW